MRRDEEPAEFADEDLYEVVAHALTTPASESGEAEPDHILPAGSLGFHEPELLLRNLPASWGPLSG